MFTEITALISALLLFFSSFAGVTDLNTDCVFAVDTTKLGDEIPDLAQCVNVWDMGTMFVNAKRSEEPDVFEFVKYVQLMACTGGSASRDLFKDPLDRSVLDDYDFTRLIENCRGILALGAKPHLKFGNTPLKFTFEPDTSGFSDNINPPDDYEAYYEYIKAIVSALVAEFGREEVASWRFGVMTEYENSDWFIAKSGSAKDTLEAYCRLYDYTAAALTGQLGDDIYIGAHSMTVTEGKWDERLFIRHCALGTNYRTGEKGSPLKYLAASFYDSRPGVYTSGKTLPQTISFLRFWAEFYGFHDLEFGIDEGRILEGNTAGTDSGELMSRSCGYTWQAAYDARHYGQMLDNDISYFSYWDYTTEGLFGGIPSVSYYVARGISKFEGSRNAKVSVRKSGDCVNNEVSVHAAFNEDSGTLRLMAYNYGKSPDYDKSKTIRVNVNAPQLPDGDTAVTVYRIDDDCNFFDEWQADRDKYGITDDMFAWSPDDFFISDNLKDQNARSLYYGSLCEKYKECSVLTPETLTVTVKNGAFSLDTCLDGNTVVFFETA